MLIEMDEVTRRTEAERLGNEIALLSAHITVATARLLDKSDACFGFRQFNGLVEQVSQ